MENPRRAGLKLTERWVDDWVHICPIFPLLLDSEDFLNDIGLK